MDRTPSAQAAGRSSQATRHPERSADVSTGTRNGQPRQPKAKPITHQAAMQVAAGGPSTVCAHAARGSRGHKRQGLGNDNVNVRNAANAAMAGVRRLPTNVPAQP